MDFDPHEIVRTDLGATRIVLRVFLYLLYREVLIPVHSCRESILNRLVTDSNISEPTHDWYLMWQCIFHIRIIQGHKYTHTFERNVYRDVMANRITGSWLGTTQTR